MWQSFEDVPKICTAIFGELQKKIDRMNLKSNVSQDFEFQKLKLQKFKIF